ncbi:MAG: AAA family ATPase [Spirochaetota bacterium]
MSKLLKAFDSYHKLNHDTYFTLLYDTLPSTLQFNTPLAENHESIKQVLALLELSKNNFVLQMKKWNTENTKNADFSKDYPYQFLFKSTKQKCVIAIFLGENSLEITYLYDCKDQKLESWVISMNHKLRTEFGLARTPSFQVLSKCYNIFTTENVRTEHTRIDLQQNYNDDFSSIHQIITNAFTTKKSGLILLYGKPGTGKTTYIKSLISQYGNLNFIFVQNEFVNNLLDPDFISFLLTQKNSVLVIEDAEKVLTSRENDREESVVSTILQLTDGLFSDYLNIKIICTFNTNLSKIDNALLRKGRIIAKYEFTPLSIEKTNLLLHSIGESAQDKEMTIASIYNCTKEDYRDAESSKIGF